MLNMAIGPREQALRAAREAKATAVKQLMAAYEEASKPRSKRSAIPPRKVKPHEDGGPEPATVPAVAGPVAKRRDPEKWREYMREYQRKHRAIKRAKRA